MQKTCTDLSYSCVDCFKQGKYSREINEIQADFEK